MTIIEKVKMALRITTSDFDDEITDLINACLLDLQIAGVVLPTDETDDELILNAVKTYCKIHFGDVVGVEMLERLKSSYDEQKAQMQMSSGYTDWGNDGDE